MHENPRTGHHERKLSTMTRYTFSINAEIIGAHEEDVERALAEAPFLIYASEVDGAHLLTVYIDAGSEDNAVRSAETFLRQNHSLIRPKYFLHELVTLPEIAARFRISHEAVRKWARGERSNSFPAMHQIAGTTQLWSWHEVYQWAMSRPNYKNKISPSYRSMPLSHVGAAKVNARLREPGHTYAPAVSNTYLLTTVNKKFLDVEILPTARIAFQKPSYRVINAISWSEPVHISGEKVEPRFIDARLADK